MKNTFRRYVSLLLSLVILFEGLLSCVSAVEETNKAEEANQITQTILNANEMTKEEMLSEAYRSLVKQKGERYYPIVEKMILDEYSKIESYSSTQDTLKRASTRIRIPNGGTVYYKDYLSTKTEVTKIYLNKSDSVKYINGSLLKDLLGYIIDLIPGISTILSVLNFTRIADREQIRKAQAGNGCLELFHSDDGDGSASLVFYWKSYPYITVESGYRLFRK